MYLGLSKYSQFAISLIDKARSQVTGGHGELMKCRATQLWDVTDVTQTPAYKHRAIQLKHSLYRLREVRPTKIYAIDQINTQKHIPQQIPIRIIYQSHRRWKQDTDKQIEGYQ